MGWATNDGDELMTRLILSRSARRRAAVAGFVFTSFRGLGTVNAGTELFSGGQAQINTAALAGPHRDQLPLNNEGIDFGTD